MKLLLVALMAMVPALPQAPSKDPKCAGAPDGIFGKNKGVYYGCLQGKEVRSDQNSAVPSAWIAEYDVKIREFDEKVRPTRAKPAEPKQTPSTTAPIPRAAPAVPSPVITEEQVNSVPLGSARADVVQTLGEPYMKISGDTERLTYRLTSGYLARLEFENGKLTQRRIVAGQ
ncbi:MAG: hypothetical protein LAO55_10270 [Acidobacteriia bacterium]|nr:hypothetical protein [Terriglobia bacterium]